MYRGTEFPFEDFSGGLNSYTPVTEVANNQAMDLSNIMIYTFGRGFRKRYGNTVFNSSAMNGGANVQGLSYFKLANTNDFLISVAGAKLYKSTSLSGTMTEITGAITITAGQNNIWTQFTFNNVHIGFGGSATAPDAPWVYDGSGGNAAALGGTPPSAYGAFQANNRVFAFRTAANPSRIFWSILGSQADWTGTGSGSADVWTNDNDSITACAVRDNSTVLIFKENSVHRMLINTLVSNAFPIYPLFSGVGCVGKHACVVADGLAYFINNQGRMKITDGVRLLTNIDFPNLNNADDYWNSIPAARRQYIQGIRKIGADYDHIVWLTTSTGTTHDTAIIWDLQNRCWLKHKTGYGANVAGLHQNGTLYTGHYDGKIYTQDVSTATTDASTGSLSIDAYWRSAWMTQKSFENIKQPRKLNLSFTTQTSGQIYISYGFDFNTDSQTLTMDQTAPGGTWDTDNWDVMSWAGQSDLIRSVRLSGRGNSFQFRIRNNQLADALKVNGLTLSGKTYGQKEIAAR